MNNKRKYELILAAVAPAKYASDWTHIQYKKLAAEVRYRWESDDHLLIAYAGTNGTIRDWVRNFVFCRTQGFHIGFLSEVLWTARSDLRFAIRQAKAVTIVGFSQGGGCAQIAQALLLRQGKLADLLTVGSPRALGFLVARKMKKMLHIRVKHGVDIVTTVPLAGLGYKHYGDKLKLKADKNNPVRNHYPENYIAAARKQLIGE